MKSKEVYVVTRDGRRIEEQNYETNEEAKARMDTLVKVLKKWKDPDSMRVKIEKTSQPKKIK
tara:strand:- start:176 stop:361 length:186 start_codon:yes stop_codon:yes gene_type:complete